MTPQISPLRCGAAEKVGGANWQAIACPINTQMALRGADTSNTSREGIGVGDCDEPAFTLQANHSHAVAYGFKAGQGAKAGSIGFQEEISPTLGAADSGSNRTPTILNRSAVRLTPVECERLQGFPDNYTLVPVVKKMAADGPRYQALGNSMAVPVMRWIGERISGLARPRALERYWRLAAPRSGTLLTELVCPKQ